MVNKLKKPSNVPERKDSRPHLLPVLLAHAFILVRCSTNIQTEEVSSRRPPCILPPLSQISTWSVLCTCTPGARAHKVYVRNMHTSPSSSRLSDVYLTVSDLSRRALPEVGGCRVTGPCAARAVAAVGVQINQNQHTQIKGMLPLVLAALVE